MKRGWEDEKSPALQAPRDEMKEDGAGRAKRLLQGILTRFLLEFSSSDHVAPPESMLFSAFRT